jgi:hypothetical protein
MKALVERNSSTLSNLLGARTDILPTLQGESTLSDLKRVAGKNFVQA